MESSSTRLQHVKGDVTIQGRGNEVTRRGYRRRCSLERRILRERAPGPRDEDGQLPVRRTDMEFSRLDGRLDLDSDDLRADSLSDPCV